MHNVVNFIKEFALSDKEVLEERDFDERIEALDALTGVRNMTATQFREAMTTAHFEDYFSDALSRAFYNDYQYKVGEWQKYVYMDTVPDFRNVSRFRMTEPGDLQLRREKAEAKATDIQESEIEYGVEEYARQFDVSWRTILNDDLGKIRETPQRMANAAARWLDSWVSALYDNATTQATLAGLGAPWSGTGRLTAANLAIGLNAMMQRTDVNDNQMNIGSVNVVIPPILRIQAADILQDLLSYGGAGGNVLGQFTANVYVDPYIATAAPNVPWYLFADPMDVPAVTFARLEGMPGPVVVKKASDIQRMFGTAPAAFMMGSFATGDIEYLVEDVVGGWDDDEYVGVTDFRGIYYSSGTTP
jgi:hypothetical protein